MPVRGGARPGAGRKKGALTKKTQEIVAQAATKGETPLEYMLRVMRTSEDSKRKDAMAIAAAPFVHPRLAAVEHSGEMGLTMHEQALVDLEKQVNGVERHQ